MTDKWISVNDRLPEHNKRKDSLGVQVLIWPHHPDGYATAFYGRRQSEKACFYLHGVLLYATTHWMPLPAGPKKPA